MMSTPPRARASVLLERARVLVDGLTMRGKGLIAVGCGLGVGALMSGQRDLLRVSVLLLALPVISIALVWRTGFRLGCTRSTSSTRVAVGEVATVSVELENLGSRTSSPMLIVDAMSIPLGAAARAVLPRLRPGERREFTHRLRPMRRGRFRVGPVSLIATDPLGLVRLRRSFRAVDSMLVVPPVHALESGGPGVEHLGRGLATTSTLAARGHDDVVPREYRIGDDLRRIHWRASARTGELMVRREEQPWTRQATVVVDTRTGSHTPTSEHSSFEVTLSLLASITTQLVRDGFDVTVRSIDGQDLAGVVHGQDGLDRLMGVLAITDTSADGQPSASALRGDLAIAIVTDTADVARILATQAARGAGDTGLAFIVSRDGAGAPRDAVSHAVDSARAGGWHAEPIPSGPEASRSFAPAWRRALGSATDVTAAAGRR